MKILILEDNLMWAPRLFKTVQAVGHEAVVISKIPEEIPPADIAIVNLGSTSMPAQDLVPRIRRAGIKVLGHAGHKEKELHQIGKEIGCDYLATNSEITHKLPDILARM